MFRRKNQKVINVSDIEHNDLIKMIDNMEGVNVRKTVNRVQISIHKQTLNNTSIGICVRNRDKKGKRRGCLTPIYDSDNRNIYVFPKRVTPQFSPSSAIIATSC